MGKKTNKSNLIKNALLALERISEEELAESSLWLNRCLSAGVVADPKDLTPAESYIPLENFFKAYQENEFGNYAEDIFKNLKKYWPDTSAIDLEWVHDVIDLLEYLFEKGGSDQVAQSIAMLYTTIKHFDYVKLEDKAKSMREGDLEKRKIEYEDNLKKRQESLCGRLENTVKAADDVEEKRIRALLSECRKYGDHLKDEVQKELDENWQEYNLKFGLSRLEVKNNRREITHLDLNPDLFKKKELYDQLQNDESIPVRIKIAIQKYITVYQLKNKLLDPDKDNKNAIKEFDDSFKNYKGLFETRRADNVFIRTIKDILAFLPNMVGIKLFKVTGRRFGENISSVASKDDKPGSKP